MRVSHVPNEGNTVNCEIASGTPFCIECLDYLQLLSFYNFRFLFLLSYGYLLLCHCHLCSAPVLTRKCMCAHLCRMRRCFEFPVMCGSGWCCPACAPLRFVLWGAAGAMPGWPSWRHSGCAQLWYSVICFLLFLSDHSSPECCGKCTYALDTTSNSPIYVAVNFCISTNQGDGPSLLVSYLEVTF